LQQAGAVLASCSYERVLERGFALVLDRGGHALATVHSLTPGLAVRLRLHDGEAGARIEDEGAADDGPRPPAKAQPAQPASRRPPGRGKPQGGQGSLF
ncbi:MAG: exodeoxyribonuclease VII large subunit, partial [Defluviicoccus sp.]